MSLKLNKPLLVIVLLPIFSCVDQNCEVSKRDFDDFSSVLYMLEESNRIDFRRFIVDNHLDSKESNEINKSIIAIYDLIDIALEELLLKSDGYNQKGELIGGSKKGDGLPIFEEKSLIENIQIEINKMKSIQSREGFLNGDSVIGQVESSLYPLLNLDENTLRNGTNAKLYLLMTIVQNKLLIAEMKYFEALNGIILNNNKEESSANI